MAASDTGVGTYPLRFRSRPRAADSVPWGAASPPPHGLLALGTAHRGGRWRRRHEQFGGCVWHARLGEPVAYGLQGGTLTGAEAAVVTHLAEPFGQDVLQETVNEVERLQGTGLPLTGPRIGVDETDLVVFEAHDTLVTDRDLENVRRQVLERRGAIADGQAMHDPVLLPDGGRDVAEQRVLA